MNVTTWENCTLAVRLLDVAKSETEINEMCIVMPLYGNHLVMKTMRIVRSSHKLPDGGSVTLISILFSIHQ
jgi:hypothetical protein